MNTLHTTCTLLTSVVLSACNATRAEEAAKPPAPATRKAPEAERTLASERRALAEDPLRRTYGPSKMKLAKCMRLETDTDTLIGENCAPGLMLFGPYIGVPSNSTLQLQFDLVAPKDVSVNGDVVSLAGKQFHTALNAQRLAANERKTVSYGFHTAQSLTAAETRIWIRGEPPINFQISNLTVSVQ